MWLYQEILLMSWKNHTTDENVLQRISKQQEILFTVMKRKLEYFSKKSPWPKESRKKKKNVGSKPMSVVWPNIGRAL